jgi:hypothetical protein
VLAFALAFVFTFTVAWAFAFTFAWAFTFTFARAFAFACAWAFGSSRCARTRPGASRLFFAALQLAVDVRRVWGSFARGAARVPPCSAASRLGAFGAARASRG